MSKKQLLAAILAPLAEGNLLVPEAAITDIIPYDKPEPFDNAPAWLLGATNWHDWQVPVLSYARLMNLTQKESIGKDARIFIVKSLLESQSLPYIGILVQSKGEAIKLQLSDLEEILDRPRMLGLYSHVKAGEKEAMIPEIDRLSQLVAHAAYGALPITRV